MGGEQAPTQGQRANLVGEYMALTPTQWSDKNKYHQTKHDQLNNLRNSLNTEADYNNASRELLGQSGADRYQVGNARDAMESIKADADAKGITLAPDVQDGIGQMRTLMGVEVASRMAGQGRAGGGARRTPGQAKAKEQTPAAADPKKDNVAVMRRRKAKGLKKVHRGDFKTPAGAKPPVAWTGGTPALEKARTMGTPMEDTPGGQDISKFLNNENKKDMPWPEKKQIWEAGSDKWSKQAAKDIGPGGQVGVATNGPINPDGVWKNTELPNFMNGGVTPNYK